MPVNKLSLIILNYNSKYWLRKCLASIREQYASQTKSLVETIVVDNNSKDGSLEMIKNEFGWVDVKKLDTNIGFSAGNNVALKLTESEYVMLLNSDIEFNTISDLDKMLSFMDDNPNIAVVTPKLLLPSGELDWACHRGEPTIWAAFTYYSGLEKRLPKTKYFGKYHQTFKDLSVSHQIDACSGAAMMIRTSQMHEVGYLDERFFMYAEDLDWCKRFREAGYEIWFFPEVEIIHHKYKSGIKTQSPLTSLASKRHFYNTMLQYYDKHYQNRYPRIVRLVLRIYLFIKKGGM